MGCGGWKVKYQIRDVVARANNLFIFVSLEMILNSVLLYLHNFRFFVAYIGEACFSTPTTDAKQRMQNKNY